MRMHIELDDDLVRRIDEIAGGRGRSRFVRTAIEHALEQETRWKLIKASLGSIADTGHEWDDDPAAWVQKERRDDRRRVG